MLVLERITNECTEWATRHPGLWMPAYAGMTSFPLSRESSGGRGLPLRSFYPPMTGQLPAPAICCIVRMTAEKSSSSAIENTFGSDSAIDGSGSNPSG